MKDTVFGKTSAKIFIPQKMFPSGKIIIPQDIYAKAEGLISRGIKEVNLSDEGDLSFVLTDNTVEYLGNIKGEDGFSPTVITQPYYSGGKIMGYLIEFTDVNGSKSIRISNGKNGENATPEQIAEAVEDYFEENPIQGGGVSFETDETLTLENGVLSVNTAINVEEDNTLPITSAAVAETVGNIEILLKTI